MPLPHSPRSCPGSSNYPHLDVRHAILMILALAGCTPGNPSPQEIADDCRARTIAHLRRAEMEAFRNGRHRTGADYVAEGQRVMSGCMTNATQTSQFCRAVLLNPNSLLSADFLALPSMIAPEMDFGCGPATP